MKSKPSLTNFVGKKTLIILVVAILIVVAGVFFIKAKGKNDLRKGESSGVIASVKDALTQNLTLACEFTDESGTSVKSYIKNGAVRVTSTGPSSVSSEIIMKDEKMYMWDTTTKEGFIYTIEDDDSSNVGMSGKDVVKSESYLDLIDKYRDSCKVANLADTFFIPPQDVNFKDMSNFLEDLKSQMPQIQIPNE